MNTSIPTQELPFQKGIKAFMARTGISQRKLAKRVFISQSSVYCWCVGKYDPSVTIALLALEGMTLEEIFGKEVAEKLIANSMPKEEPVEVKKEKRTEVQKKGFMSRLVMLFSAKR